MAWTSQEVKSAIASANQVTVTLTSAIAAGDLLIAWCHCASGDPVATPVSDGTNGTWPNDGISGGNTTLLVSGMGGVSSGRLYLAWVKSLAAAGGVTVTVKGFATASRTHAICRRLTPPSGSPSIVTSQSKDGGATAGTAEDSGTTAGSASVGDLILAAFVNSSGSGVTETQGNPSMTAGIWADATTTYLWDELNLNGPAGTVDATSTKGAAANWLGATAVFSAGAAGGPPGFFIESTVGQERPGPRPF